jgi:hypothetical protein
MSHFTDDEKRGYRSVVDAIIRGDTSNKETLDTAARKLLASIRELLPEASSDMLAEFAAAITGVAGVILRCEVGKASDLVMAIYQDYAVLTAILVGVYDPDSEEVPDTDNPDFPGLLSRLLAEREPPARGDEMTGFYL